MRDPVPRRYLRVTAVIATRPIARTSMPSGAELWNRHRGADHLYALGPRREAYQERAGVARRVYLFMVGLLAVHQYEEGRVAVVVAGVHQVPGQRESAGTPSSMESMSTISVSAWGSVCMPSTVAPTASKSGGKLRAVHHHHPHRGYAVPGLCPNTAVWVQPSPATCHIS